MTLNDDGGVLNGGQNVSLQVVKLVFVVSQKKIVFEFLKIKEHFEYSFTQEQINEYEIYVMNTINKIKNPY